MIRLVNSIEGIGSEDFDDQKSMLLDKYRDVQKLKDDEIKRLHMELEREREKFEKISEQMSGFTKDAEVKEREIQRLLNEMSVIINDANRKDEEILKMKEMHLKLTEKGMFLSLFIILSIKRMSFRGEERKG